jgi:23S rRNA (cytosine1962-C5)-methyltransferase
MAGKNPLQPAIQLLAVDDWQDYELLDSGNCLKLERFGSYTFVRPEHQAIWHPALDEQAWRSAHGKFIATAEESGGHWSFRAPVPEFWPMKCHGLTFYARPSNSRHLGFFPEQAVHWEWIGKQISRANRELNILNLFGYTGVATLAAVKAGARVTHVDASKKSVSQARENQLISHLESAPVRWIVDDVVKFVRREARRGTQYDGIILDPPKFGRGPKGEVWEFFEMLPILLQEIHPLISNKPVFVVITAYAIRASALSLNYAIDEMMREHRGTLTSGELVSREKSAGRYISLAIWARWTSVGE